MQRHHLPRQLHDHRQLERVQHTARTAATVMRATTGAARGTRALGVLLAAEQGGDGGVRLQVAGRVKEKAAEGERAGDQFVVALAKAREATRDEKVSPDVEAARQGAH